MFMSDSLPPAGGRVMVSGEIPWETQYNQFMFWSIVVGLIVFVWLLYAVLRFRRGMVDESNLEKLEPGTFPKERDNLRLEAVWVVIPSILVAWLCLLSWTSMYDAWGNPPSDEEAFVVEVTATQWNWAYTYTEPLVIEEATDGLSYPIHVSVSEGAILVSTSTVDVNLTAIWTNGPANGQFNISSGLATLNTVVDMHEMFSLTITDEEGLQVYSYVRYAAQTSSSGEVYVPCDRTIKMTMNSERLDEADAVIHSMFLPEWGMKEDLVPNLETMLYFHPEEIGTYDVICAEYCGMRHAYMTGKITVVANPNSDLESCGGGA